MNCTLTIHLGNSWTDPKQVKFSAIVKPSSPVFDNSALWYDSVGNSIYSFGGEQSLLDNAQLDLSIWRLDLDGKGGGRWAVNTTYQNPPFSQDMTRPFGGASAFTNSSAFYIGGASNYRSSPSLQKQLASVVLPGLVSYSFDTGAWKNSSGLGALSSSGSFQYGGVEPVPFGPNGLLAMWGGETSNASSYAYGLGRAMDQITLYNPTTNIWYQQNITGAAPIARSKFCFVGVADSRPVSTANPIGSYEIYIYGGYSGSLGQGAEMFDEIWVLSLPAFTWQQLDGSHSSARIGHTCHVVANRQMLSVG